MKQTVTADVVARIDEINGIINTKQMATVGIIIGAVGLILGYLMLIFIGF